ncbi:MAG: response regulator [Planctomycetota bacterium]
MRRVMLVEDEPLVRDLWTEVLQVRGFEVVECGSGQEALDALAQGWVPDVALVDLGLPDMSGLDLLTELRRDHGGVDLPVIVLSGSTSERDMSESFQAGANDYLVKPARPSEVLAKLEVHLSKSQRLRSQARRARFQPGEVACERYLVERVLGEGSFGVVYQARDLRHGGALALKVLTSNSPADRARFLRECYLLAAVESPHVARVLDHGEVGGALYLGMELVEGETLEAHVRRHGPCSAEDVRLLLLGLGRALEALAAQGVIHRDIKPGNVVLRDGRVDAPVLIDFGLAKRGNEAGLTSPEVMLGTPGYMAPEHLTGRPLDVRSDLFSVGLVGRYAAVGREPLPHLSGLDLIQWMARRRLSLPAHLPTSLRRVLGALTEPDVERRLGSPAALVRYLEAVRVDPEEVRTQPVRRPAGARMWA